MKLLEVWWVSAESRPCSTRWRTSALPVPLVSLRNTRSGAWATSTPPLQNSKPVGQCRPSAKTVHLVGLAGALGVFEDEELVVHRLLGLPVRIGRPDGHPQPALGVQGHLHRVDQFGEVLLRGEQIDLHPLADRHLVDGLLAVEEDVLAAGAVAGLVGLDGDERRRVAVVDLEIAALGDGPDALVAVGGHHIEDLHLALGDHYAIGLAIPTEAQVGPAAVDRVAIDSAVAVEPVEVLVRARPGGSSPGPSGSRLAGRPSANRAWSMISASEPVALWRSDGCR